MRSHYDDFAASETNNINIIKMSSSSSCSSSRNNNITNENNNYSNNGGAIPYHARENSLPFSYGQISKTSTPLRPTTNATLLSASQPQPSSSSVAVSRSYKNGVEHDFDFDFDFGLSSQRNNNGVGSYTKTSNGSSGVVGGAYNSNGSGKDVNYNLTQSDCANLNKSSARMDLNSKRFNDQNSCTQTLRYTSSSNNSNKNDEPDASMIKTQPRLTSPLLVRKTLGGTNSNSNNNNNNNSRSPTRSNTIANTYHYSYGNTTTNHKNNNVGGGGGGGGGSSSSSSGGDNNFDKFGVNGNINNNNNASYGGHREQPTTRYGGVGGGGDTLSKTPVRHDLDELLRERREKVFNEYRSTTHEVLTPQSSPLPPPRRFANGTVQLPSTLPPSLKHQQQQQQQHNGSLSSSNPLYAPPPQVPSRNSSSQNSKYNYDFQFNLNLEDRDDVDGDILRRRNHNHTMERSPQRQLSYPYEQKQLQLQQQQSLYQTRNIPLASSSSYVEHNYHTIGSSSAGQNHNNNNTNGAGRGETLSPASMLDIYATPYDERIDVSYNNRQMPNNGQSATTLRSRRSDYSATYGNGNMSNHEPPHLVAAAAAANTTNLGHAMTDRELSPIYATTTKKVNTTTSHQHQAAARYRSNSVTAPSHLAASSPSAATSTTTLYVTDYPSPLSGGQQQQQQRPETPAFPVTPRTPFGGTIANSSYNVNTISSSSTLLNRSNGSNGYPHSQTSPSTPHPQMHHHQQQQQQQQNSSSLADIQNYSTETIYGTNYRPRLNSSLSMANSEPQEVAAHLVKFAKDSSKFWYKPNLSREDAISLLLNATPGTFVVRDSTTYKNAYGLVLRVAQPPAGSINTGKQDELVRHFLIEPTTRGVRLKGCPNEPVFTSLSALVYEHSINQLALPCVLQIPDHDIVPPLIEHTPAQKQLLTQGAACNVLWLYSCDTESLTGEEAIRKAIRQLNGLPAAPVPTEVHFKVSQQGITLTDNTRKKFFRKHYTADIISYCAIDPDHRMWTMQEHGSDNTTVVGSLKKTIFAFVARRSASSKDNQCHIFCDLAITQPASAIVSFVNKTLPTEKQKNYVL